METDAVSAITVTLSHKLASTDIMTNIRNSFSHLIYFASMSDNNVCGTSYHSNFIAKVLFLSAASVLNESTCKIGNSMQMF